MNTLFQLAEMLPLNVPDQRCVELPDLTNPSEYIEIETVDDLKAYAPRFVNLFGQCLFKLVEGVKFAPVDCYRFEQAKNNLT